LFFTYVTYHYIHVSYDVLDKPTHMYLATTRYATTSIGSRQGSMKITAMLPAGLQVAFPLYKLPLTWKDLDFTTYIKTYTTNPILFKIHLACSFRWPNVSHALVKGLIPELVTDRGDRLLQLLH